MPKNFYEIHIKGNLDPDWANWFNEAALTKVGEDEIMLSGELADQTALHGMLAQIRDLNLTLISVQITERPDLG